jgi:putative aldouronate transport system permease protein
MQPLSFLLHDRIGGTTSNGSQDEERAAASFDDRAGANLHPIILLRPHGRHRDRIPKVHPRQRSLRRPTVDRVVMHLPSFTQVLLNTLLIASFKLILGLLVPIVFAILLNEVKNAVLKRTVQTTIYLPYFLSWVVLGGILVDILSPSGGIVNGLLTSFGFPKIFFLGDNDWFPATLIGSDVWKNFGYGTIVYLAAITGIDPGLYEAATIDGANRWRKIWHITLPGMRMVIVLLSVLSLGQLLNAGFDQVFNLYSPQVYESGDILDTFVYRIGLLDAQYGVATAVGFFKSIVSLILISASYFFAYYFARYRIF